MSQCLDANSFCRGFYEVTNPYYTGILFNIFSRKSFVRLVEMCTRWPSSLGFSTVVHVYISYVRSFDSIIIGNI